MLKENEKAPGFKLKDYDENLIDLEDFKGKKVVLYFYPKDDTPGCTVEAKDFSELMPEFEKLNTIITGISKDSVSSHCKFRDKYQLKVLLLSDEKEEVLKSYGVIQEKNMYGKKVNGIVRTTVIIDESGIVKKIYNKVNAEGHAREVLEYLT